MIEVGLIKMDELKGNYKKDVATWKKELDAALDKSRELSLPEPFVRASGMTQLKFVALASATSKKMFDAKETKALNLTYTPIKSYPLKKLEKMGVITEVFPPFGENEIKKTMNVTVRHTPSAPGGGVELVVTIVKKGNTTTIKTLCVSDSAISDMKTSDKGTKAPLANPG